MIILGLTGSIGMGKSTTANFFKQENIPVYDADAIVHQLYENDLVLPISKVFPNVIVQNKVDRNLLGKEVLGNSEAMKKLEEIVHPVVHQHRINFLEKERQKNTPLVVLDIPLLFEKNLEEVVDKIVVVSAPFEIQKERVLSREGMGQEKFEKILNRQMPDWEKRKRADFIIETDKGLSYAKNQVLELIDTLTSE